MFGWLSQHKLIVHFMAMLTLLISEDFFSFLSQVPLLCRLANGLTMLAGASTIHHLFTKPQPKKIQKMTLSRLFQRKIERSWSRMRNRNGEMGDSGSWFRFKILIEKQKLPANAHKRQAPDKEFVGWEKWYFYFSLS